MSAHTVEQGVPQRVRVGKVGGTRMRWKRRRKINIYFDVITLKYMHDALEGSSDMLHNAVTNHVPGHFDRVASVFASLQTIAFLHTTLCGCLLIINEWPVNDLIRQSPVIVHFPPPLRRCHVGGRLAS